MTRSKSELHSPLLYLRMSLATAFLQLYFAFVILSLVCFFLTEIAFDI